MVRWGFVVWLGMVAFGCGDTTRNGEPEGDSGDGATSANGASNGASTDGTGGPGEMGAGGQASAAGGDTMTTAGSGAASGCIAPAGDLPDLEGQEYLLGGAFLDERIHLRFDSNSTAVLTPHFGTPEVLEVQRGTCASVDSIQTAGAEFELVGPILLNTADGTQRLALSDAGGDRVGDEAILNQPVPCYGSRILRTSVEPDRSTTEARVETRFDILIPWEPIVFNTSKPPGVSLSETIVIRRDGDNIDFDVDGEHQISLLDWSSSFGTTLDLSADIVSTNGVASPFSAERMVVDLEPTSSSLATITGPAEGMALITESAAFLPPGDPVCSDGCVGIGSNGGFAFALSGVQATALIVHHIGGRVEASFGTLASTTPAQLSLALPGSAPETHVLPGANELTATEIPLPRELAPDEVVYGLVTGAWGEVQVQPGDACNTSGVGATVYLEGIELAE